MLICNHATIRNYDHEVGVRIESFYSGIAKYYENKYRPKSVFFFSDIAHAQNYRPIEAYFCEELELKKPTILYGHRIMF